MKFNLLNDKGTFQINFTLEGKRKRLYPGTSDKVIARQIVRQMAYEWELGTFDLSLKSYKLKNRQQPKVEPDEPEPKLLDVWDKWVESLFLPESTKNGHYHLIRQAIKKDDPLATDAKWFVILREEWSTTTWGNRKSYLKTCLAWAIEEELIEGRNPYSSLRPLKGKASPDKIKPFTADEISRILKAFDTNRFVSPHSRYKHSHYSSFVRFLFITGCRLGEATGLTWDCVDFSTRVITIKQALGKDMSLGPSATRKIVKKTKTGNVRRLPMNEDLYQLLNHQFNKGKRKYVFYGYRGSYIDTANFRTGIWKKILAGLEIEYRYPYQTKHSVLSQVAQKHGLAAAAKLAGHVDLTMCAKHYVRFVGDLEDVMPTLD